MRKMTVLGASALLVAGLMVSPAAAFAAPVLTDTSEFLEGVQVCEGYDSGKKDTEGDPMSVTFNAPEGELISGYCVKAGSTKQGEDEGGAYFVTLDEPAASVTITYPWGPDGGRAVSHYAVEYADGEIVPSPSPTPSVPGEEPTEEPTEEPSGTPVPSALPGDESPEPTVAPTGATSEPSDGAGVAEGDEPPVLAATGASTAIGFTLIALALVGGGVTLIVLRRKGVLGS